MNTTASPASKGTERATITPRSAASAKPLKTAIASAARSVFSSRCAISVGAQDGRWPSHTSSRRLREYVRRGPRESPKPSAIPDARIPAPTARLSVIAEHGALAFPSASQYGTRTRQSRARENHPTRVSASERKIRRPRHQSRRDARDHGQDTGPARRTGPSSNSRGCRNRHLGRNDDLSVERCHATARKEKGNHVGRIVVAEVAPIDGRGSSRYSTKAIDTVPLRMPSPSKTARASSVTDGAVDLQMMLIVRNLRCSRAGAKRESRPSRIIAPTYCQQERSASSRPLFRVLHSAVIDADEGLDETFTNLGELAKSQAALLELPVVQTFLNELIHQAVDPRGSWFDPTFGSRSPHSRRSSGRRPLSSVAWDRGIETHFPKPPIRRVRRGAWPLDKSTRPRSCRDAARSGP